MMSQVDISGRSKREGSPVSEHGWESAGITRGRVLVVEDEAIIRESMGLLLEEAGYEIWFAENGREALTQLRAGALPDLIVLDLRMPLMDGWEFRTIQKDDPRLGRIPVVAISADGSAQASAISAQAHLRKPVGARELLATVERILLESRRTEISRMDETDRLASLGRLAAGVGHEINNPLAYLVLNLNQSLERLRLAAPAPGASPQGPPVAVELSELKLRLAGVVEMLEDCQIGVERIRTCVGNLQRLSRKAEDHRGPLEVRKLIEQAASTVWNQIRHRARLITTFDTVPTIRGNQAMLEQVFLNLLLNAAQAIPEGDAERNEIRISTKLVSDEKGEQILIEISDSGGGIASENLCRVFEPFFTTKPMGQGTGLGLSISRQTVNDHGGRITIESRVGAGTAFRVFLPVGPAITDVEKQRSVTASASSVAKAVAPLFRGRLLVIDDEPLIGRVIRTALRTEHEVVVVHRASEAVTLLEGGETFDLVLCDVMMPDLSGPQFHATLKERWPELGERLVFMTGGAFTPETAAFIERVPTRIISKPFKIDLLQRLVRERIRGHA